METIESGSAIHTVQTRQPRAAGQSVAESLVHRAAHVLGDKGPRALRDFDEFPAPLYATDETGKILYFNPACVDFAGRTPTLGSDRWCVSWKLFTSDGAALPHDKCPMAVAVHDGQPVRDVEAFAERPDGKRIRFRPFPTPATNDDGRIVGAVNMLVPLDGNIHRDLVAKADKCRTLARWMTDKQAKDVLSDMAKECEHQAAALRLD